jgi:hypothetical protein
MPSCELPAMRMTASLIFEILAAPFDDGAFAIASLMKPQIKIILPLQSGAGR